MTTGVVGVSGQRSIGRALATVIDAAGSPREGNSSGAVEHSVIRCDEFARRLPTSSHGFQRMHQSYLCFGWRKHRARASKIFQNSGEV